MIVDLVAREDFVSLFVSVSTGLALLATFAYFRKRSNDSTSPPVAPISMLETVTEFSGDYPHLFVLRMIEKTGSAVYKVKLPLPGNYYVVNDAALQREIFQDKTTDKPVPMMKAFDKICGQPSIASRSTFDPLWKSARKGSAPAFSSKEVNRMNQVCNKHLERWIRETLKPNQAFDPSVEMTKLTFGIIMESAFEYEPTDEEYKEFEHHLEVVMREYVFKQTVNPLRSTLGFLFSEVREANRSCKEVKRFAQRVLEHYRNNPNKSPQNTLIKLIENNENFTDEMKVSELFIYIVAGHDTTGFSLASTLIQLAKHPDICQKARESLQGSSKTSDYLRYCISESNRLVPVAAMGSSRTAGRDYTFVDCISKKHLKIPKGGMCFMPQYAKNRNPSVYPSPNQFIPERWAEPTKAMTDSHLAFALGSRNCIGQSLATAEMHSVLPRLLSDYSLELEEEGELEYFLTLKYAGARIKARPITK